jgi:maltose alpha-D-glucosyltransferase / alpha-amylase
MILEDDPRWYQKAVIYQIHVRAFYDSNRDGIGDLQGVTAKLPYLQELGVNTIWLLPFYPSPLRDGGYDISDYCGIHPDYGTMRDFQHLVETAHELGIRVITELVLNHTSDQHPWFKNSRTAPPGSRWWNFYVWRDDPTEYAQARIIFKDFETSNWTWDPVAKAYFWHRFYSHQPDLNWDNPEVEEEMFKVVDFWLSMGIDGVRLDAVPYLYERNGTICENLPETHAALKRLRKHVDEHFPNRMLLAEANQWPEDAASYFGAEDECHMNFHFPLMPRIYLATEMEDRFPVLDILEQTPQIPPSCRWAIFLRNHDELTLEMVSDVERDHLWRAYASDPRARINLGIRRRLAPLVGNDRRRIELLNGLLFSLEGTPIIYYGDEIGMGDNIYLGDRDGVRTPMQWNADRNAGFSESNPQQLYLPVNVDPEYRYEAINVESQMRTRSSLYWWMRRIITLRIRSTALATGTTEFVRCSNARVLAFLRRHPEQSVLVVANLAASVQYAELDLSMFEGQRPRELFSAGRFPGIGKQPYLLTLGPHAFYWLDVGQPADAIKEATSGDEIPQIKFDGDLADLLHGKPKSKLEKILPAVLPTRRWFGGKGRDIAEAAIVDDVKLDDRAVIAIVEVTFEGHKPETYCVPLAAVEKPDSKNYLEQKLRSVFAIVRRRDPERDAVIVDALEVPEVRALIADAIAAKKRLSGKNGHVEFERTRAFSDIAVQLETAKESSLLGAEQSNTSLLFGEGALLKLFRRALPGINPDLEMGRHLTEHTDFRDFPAVGGALIHYRRSGEPITVAVLQGFVPNQGDGFKIFSAELDRFFLRTLTAEPSQIAATHGDLLGSFLPMIEDLGTLTAELHAALAQPSDDPAFHPEPFAPFDQRGFYQSLRSLASRVLQTLAELGPAGLTDDFLVLRDAVLAERKRIFEAFGKVLGRPISGKRIRCHGDYHLAQVLRAGTRWIAIDFEGEPTRSVGERRLKRSGLKDVAGMVRSMDYVATLAIDRQVEAGLVRTETLPHQMLIRHARAWRDAASAVFLSSYFRHPHVVRHLPETEEERAALLRTHLLEKALYELAYELGHRPRLASVPARAILELIA